MAASPVITVSGFVAWRSAWRLSWRRVPDDGDGWRRRWVQVGPVELSWSVAVERDDGPRSEAPGLDAGVPVG